jgi:uncharacterized protein
MEIDDALPHKNAQSLSNAKQSHMALDSVQPQVMSAKERFDILDIVRGIALLGVLLANMPGHSYLGYFTTTEQSILPLASLNEPLRFLAMFFLDGKFYTLFSLLFGLGFSLIVSKAGSSHIMVKRLLVLVCFGLLHALLLWGGDILLLYALLGFSLPLFNRLNDKAILILAIFLLISPIILDGARMVTDGDFSPEKVFYEKNKVLAIDGLGSTPLTDSNLAIWMKNGDFKDLLYYNYTEIYYRWGYLLGSNRLPKVLGLFLIGLLIGRHKMFSNLIEHIPRLRQIRNWGFLVGIPTSLVYAYTAIYTQQTPLAVKSALYVFSVFPMAFAYGASICLLYVKGSFSALFTNFRYVGKMALTVYLLQSFVGVLVFHGLGLGLAGEMGFFEIYTFGFVFFVLQVLFCRWWLNRYAFGPCEWIWRQLTYGKRIPLKLEANSG